MESPIVYIEYKGDGSPVQADYFDIETGDHYWIARCERDGSDRLYGERTPVEIDDDARELPSGRLGVRSGWMVTGAP